MGNISFSHCNDAIIIAWHQNKIGIDIERIDRKFNYEKLAKKYFLHPNFSKKKISLNKSMILNQWCAIEAAVKWDHGKLSSDIKQWKYLKDNNELIHQNKNLHLNFTHIIFDKWTISLALKENLSFIPHFICSNRKF